MRNHTIYIGIISGFLLNSSPLCGNSSRFQGSEHWDVYGEFLYMKRSDLNNISIVKNGDSTDIRTKNLIDQFDFEPGYRVGLMYSPTQKIGIEGIFSYLQPWEGSKEKQHDNSLSFPFNSSDYDLDFTDASLAKANYACHFWDAELNFWRYFTPRLASYFGCSGLMGLRFFIGMNSSS